MESPPTPNDDTLQAVDKLSKEVDLTEADLDNKVGMSTTSPTGKVDIAGKGGEKEGQASPDLPWTCIAITCEDHAWTEVFREEVYLLHKQGLLPSLLPCAVVQDPVGGVGSGGAFLNALLVVTEHICHSRGLTTMTSDVLDDARILIVHHGKSSCYWPGPKSLLPSLSKRADGTGPASRLEEMVSLCQILARRAPFAGVWVASTDWLPHRPSELWKHGRKLDPLHDQVVVFRSISPLPQWHRSVAWDAENLAKSGDGELWVDPIVGPVFMTSVVAQALLSVHATPPLDRCTYVGEDSGRGGLQLSLHIDIFDELMPSDGGRGEHPHDLAQGWDRSTKKSDDRMAATALLRQSIERLGHSALELYFFLDSKGSQPRHALWNDRLPFGSVFASYLSRRPTDGKVKCVDSVVAVEVNGPGPILAIASHLTASRPGTVIQCRGRTCLVNMNLDLDVVPPLELQDNTVAVGHWIRLDDQSVPAVALFSVVDVPMRQIGHHEDGVFGVRWSTYLAAKGMCEEDLWPATLPADQRCLWTAKLYPMCRDAADWYDLVWLQDLEEPSCRSRLSNWRHNRRFSMQDFQTSLATDTGEMARRRRAAAAAAALRRHLDGCRSLLPLIRRSCAEGWTDAALEALDRAAAGGDRSRACRMLAAVANLLAHAASAASAGSRGAGLTRNGPAHNGQWQPALQLLAAGDLKEGVAQMAQVRTRWMNSAERMVRAARHYERAVHLLIGAAVRSVRYAMADAADAATENRPRPPLDVEIRAECPARIDLSGGWSDTPPICYEMGGCVVNMAVLVDGRRPIGAASRRIAPWRLVLAGATRSEPELEFQSADQVLDLRDPTAPGALFKAVLVCAGVVRPEDAGSDGWEPILRRSIGSGLCVQAWSNLPQGSGMGTSSILAAAVLAVVYAAMGVSFTRSHLIHAVLYVEQLLTTGGGWQDQVGGVYGGFNLGQSPADADRVRIVVNPLDVGPSPCWSELLERHLVLVFTGRVRLARHLLQNVVRQWYAGDAAVVDCFRQLVVNAERCADVLRAAPADARLARLGHAVDVYWAQKKTLAPGSQPPSVGVLMERLRPLVHGQSLTGAGGGGFYFGLLRDPRDRPRVASVAAEIDAAMTLHDVSVDRTGLQLVVDGRPIHIGT